LEFNYNTKEFNMNITVIGCGRWGSLITWYLDNIGHNVTLYGRSTSANMKRLMKERKNDLLELPRSVMLTYDIETAKNAEVIIISVSSQGFKAVVQELERIGIKNKIIVLCMKGLEILTGRRLSEIASSVLDNTNKIAVWLGPGHVQEFLKGNPNCMVIDSDDKEVTKMLVKEFSSDLIRFYYGRDMIGNEVGAATKNVIGIAAGMLDGLALSALKGALMSRGTWEIAKLIKAMGGSERSAYGLCHLGDYEATVFSKYSHNRKFGEAFINGEKFEKLAEGYYTVQALMVLKEKYDVELPICTSVYNILFRDSDPKAELNSLFNRDLTKEFK
jgi:glycerol-3-phosphate dehydrogenase (NAD(P)+)